MPTGRGISTLILFSLALSAASCMWPPGPYSYPPAGAAPGGSPSWAGTGPLWFGSRPPGQELSVEEAKDGLQRWLARSGNARLKVGKVFEKDGATIGAEVVTLDNSLVQRIEIDRRSGAVWQADGDGRSAWNQWGEPYGRAPGGQGTWRGWTLCPFCGTY